MAPSSARAQTLDPTLSVGVGIQSSYQHTEATGAPGLNQFALNHARIYLGGTILKDVSVMFNTDYDSSSNKIGILDAVGQINLSPKLHVWFGRFLPPSDRANLYGPFYANEWAVYTDGIQDGYPFIFQGRDNGAMYWGDFKAGMAKIKVSAGAFTTPGSPKMLVAGRVQVDFWDPEDGYYLNGTYYGDKNLLAIGAATEEQSNKTATTVDFLMERKVMNGGAFTVESEYSNYNRLGGYNGNYAKSQGAYALASFLIPKQVAIGKFEVMGKYAIAQFTHGFPIGPHPSYRQNTTEVNFNYVMKQFDARIMTFYEDERFTKVNPNAWEAGIGLQLQLSKMIH